MSKGCRCGHTQTVTFYISNFYTRFPYILVFETLDYWLTTYQENLHSKLKKEFVLESSNFIRKNNTLTFDSEFYLQIKGTTMGRIFSPTYANLTMLYHQTKFYSIMCQRHALAGKYNENSLFRFLDHCQILLTRSLTLKPDHKTTDHKTRSFTLRLNQLKNNIQFTMEKSQTKLPSLIY